MKYKIYYNKLLLETFSDFDEALIFNKAQVSLYMKIFDFLGTLTQKQIAIGGVILIFIIGVGDYFIGSTVSTSIFYVLPICICAWHGSRALAVTYSFFSAITWFLTEMLSGLPYNYFLTPYWNTLARLATFLVIAYSLSGYRALLTAEEKLADTDSLTGAYNNRAFYEKVEAEVIRSRRFHRPFSLAYIDLDNFKFINDNLGHEVGDLLLKKVIEIMKLFTRQTDCVSRLGGDEFSVLFSEADEQAASEAIQKLHSVLLSAMQVENWPVTFSIGVVTCIEAPESVKQIISFADGLMYSVKKSGKNRVAHASYQTATDSPI